MTNATEQNPRYHLQRILYIYQLFGLTNDIVRTLGGWLALDSSYIYSVYYVLEIVLSTTSIPVIFIIILRESTIMIPIFKRHNNIN